MEILFTVTALFSAIPRLFFDFTSALSYRVFNNRFSYIVNRLLCVLLMSFSQVVASNDISLPDLGGASGGLVSNTQEKEIGQDWLRVYRSQVRTSSDSLLQDYTEQLVSRLAKHSDLELQSFDVLVVPNGSINAFAVPGGVIGVHTGLFAQAQTEDQFATVMAHELAHLSQRHFARQVEQQQNQSVAVMATQLAALVLAATAGADAGLAAMTVGQAAAIDQRLRYSRQYEQEADRVGMRTLTEAGFDPYASAEMFEIMLRATRYTRRPPEFLLTHPVTEKRIADTRNRAQKFKQQPREHNEYFHLIRTRARLMHDESPQASIKRFQAELDGEHISANATRYGLSLAYLKASRFDDAKRTLEPLLASSEQPIIYGLLAAEIDTANEQYQQATARLEALLKEHPHHYPLQMSYAETLMKAGRFTESERQLELLSRQRTNDHHVWYLLAEVYGLAGNTIGVHQARAEYFVLSGVFDKARRHINHALKLVDDNYPLTARLEERLRQIQRMQQQSRL